jgi:hypothetical protein
MFLRGGTGTRKRYIDLDIEFKAHLSLDELAEKIAEIRLKYSVEARNELVGYLLPIAVSVASRYAVHFKNMQYDLVSVAFLELTRVVDSIAQGACEHDGYINYISTAISGRCARAIEASRLVRVPYEVTQQPDAVIPSCILASDPIEAETPAPGGGLPDPITTYFNVAGFTDDERMFVDLSLAEVPLNDIVQAMGHAKNTVYKIRDSAYAKLKKVLYP